jgi:hypothetical protein
MAIALERSTVALVASFRDEDNELITPTVINWTLTDGDGNTVNDRAAVVVSPANQITIVLSGDDLAMAAGDDGRRQVVVRAEYDGALGDGLPIVGVIEFTIRNVPGIVGG